VTYRYGWWHEVTVTFDGRTLTLYLDGVMGCRGEAVLDTRDERSVLATHLGTGSTFRGSLRELRISNGVREPVPFIAVVDTLADPDPFGPTPADRMIETCPTPDAVASVDADLQLLFDADPTAREPFACTAGRGSRNLTYMQLRAYTTLLLMRQLRFREPLPWTDRPLYAWLVSAIRGIRFRSDISNSYCCSPAGIINVAVSPTASVVIGNGFLQPGGTAGFMFLAVHEARHADGYPHTCGTRDRTVAEHGAWGVQYLLSQWLLEHGDPEFLFSESGREIAVLRQMIAVHQGSFCER
jgi:hypothetical protein